MSGVLIKSEGQKVDIEQIRSIISQSEAAFVMSGAGMSASSNLPTFRGRDGFWNAYPPYRNIGISFEGLANPNTFINDLSLALGFYGSRLHQYQHTKPHEGYNLINKWLSSLPKGGHIMTSNVDGHHFTEGFDRVYEVHGSIHHWQCMSYECTIKNGLTHPPHVEVNLDTMRAKLQDEHYCQHCENPLRPNILMFDDYNYVSSRTNEQSTRFNQFRYSLSDRPCKGVVIEIGAGSRIPTIRFASENISRELGFTHIVINADDDSDIYQRSPNTIYLIGDAKQAINMLLS